MQASKRHIEIMRWKQDSLGLPRREVHDAYNSELPLSVTEVQCRFECAKWGLAESTLALLLAACACRMGKYRTDRLMLFTKNDGLCHTARLLSCIVPVLSNKHAWSPYHVQLDTHDASQGIFIALSCFTRTLYRYHVHNGDS